MTNTVILPSGPALVNVDMRNKFEFRRITVETLDWRLMLGARRCEPGFIREWQKYSRVYGALDAFLPGFSAQESELVKAADPDVADKALRSFQRRSVKVVNASLPGAIESLADVLRGVGVSLYGHDAGVESKFSRNAGCGMCPCSPGFVLSSRLSAAPSGRVSGAPVDLWFDEA